MAITRRMLLGSTIGSAAAAAWPTAEGHARSEQRVSSASARTIGRFLDSVAIGAHWTYADTPYGSAYARVRDLLVASGIRHVRAELQSDRLGDLAGRGVLSTVNVGPENGSVGAIVARIKALNASRRVVAAVEGPNEPDVFWARLGITYQGQGFPAGTTAFMRDLYRALKADRATAGLPVIGPALGRTYNPGAGRPNPFRPRELTAMVDWGNFHPFPGGGNSFSFPFSYAGISRYHWFGTFPGVNLNDYPYARETYAPPFAPKPMAATETGYSTVTGGTSEEVHAVYVPRIFCEYFRSGVVRTYLYELLDAYADPTGRDKPSHFGLLRHNLTPKPAFVALQSFLRVLRDTDRRAGSGRRQDLTINVEPSGSFTRTSYAHHLLLRGANGALGLLLWHEVAGEDISQRPHRRVRAPALPTTVRCSTPPRTATLYDYDDGWRLSARTAPRDGQRIAMRAGERVSLLVLT